MTKQKEKLPVRRELFLRLSKNLRKSSENRAAGELEGVKTRHEYNSTSSEQD